MKQRVVGWQAAFVVEGDPVAVWDRYAAALDLGDQTDARYRCSVFKVGAPTASSGDGYSVGRLLTEPPIDGENHLGCQSQQMSMEVGVGPCLRKDLQAPCARRSVGHLYIQVRDDGVADRSPLLPDRGNDPMNLPTFQADLPSNLPAAGERLDDGLDYFLNVPEAPALVPPGARSLVAPAMLGTYCNSGLVAVLDVPGKPERAIERFSGPGDPPMYPEGDKGDGRTWASGMLSLAGAYGLTLTAVEAPGGLSTVLIRECGD